MHQRKCKICPDWHDLDEPWPQACIGHYREGAERGQALTIIKDIEPYKNVIDRKVIGGRRQHREFLREHGVVEAGNEPVKAQRRPMPDNKQGRAEALKRSWEQLGYDR